MNKPENYSLKDVADITFYHVCPCCNHNVFNGELWVEENKYRYHYSCYNMMKSKEQEQE